MTDSELGGGGQALRVNSTGHKWGARGKKEQALGSGWLGVQPTSPAYQLCDLGRTGNLCGPHFPHLPNENSHLAYISSPSSLSSPDQARPSSLHTPASTLFPAASSLPA